MRRQDGKICLIDFGAVKQLTSLTVTSQGQVKTTVTIGTPGYMPAEQSNGKPRLSSDLYAVGITAIEALTGLSPQQLPDDPRTGDLIWRDRVRISDPLANFLTKMVRYHFGDRYLSAVEAHAALQQLFSTSPPPPPPPPIPPTVPVSRNSPRPPVLTAPDNSRRRFLWLAGLGGTGLVGAVVGSRFLLKQTGTGNSTATISTDPPGFSPQETNNNPPPIQQNSSGTQTPESVRPGQNSGLQVFSFETVQVNNRGEIISRQEKQAEYFRETQAANLEMVAIPGGKFRRGSPESELARRSNEGPQKSVTVPAFFMGRYPVTNQEWRAVMQTDPSAEYQGFEGDRQPVIRVSWDMAQEFCQKLSERTQGRRQYRLPSEAEWEYACRAGTSTPFYFGETITTDLANYYGNDTYGSGPKGEYRKKTTEVGTFPANAFGLCDLHGNVWEWCQDYYVDSYEGAPLDGSPGLSSGGSNNRVLRGGSWCYNPVNCRSAYRLCYSPDFRSLSYGFRVVCSSA